jgi:hypothetical protein
MSKWRLFWLIDLVVLVAFVVYEAKPIYERVRLLAGTSGAAREAPPRAPASAVREPDVPLRVVMTALESARSSEDAAGTTAALATARERLAELDARELARFAAVEKHLREQNLPSELLVRNERAFEKYQSRMEEFRASLERLEGAPPALRTKGIAELSQTLAAGPARQVAPVDVNRLPFRPVAPVTRAPRVLRSTSSALTASAAPADLQATEDAQLTASVRDLATSLGNDPVRIFNWVHDNIAFLPTYGSVQGSELTLVSKQGNAFDTASLLVALLRAAGVPARYVEGTIDVPVDRVLNWLGGVPTVSLAQQLLTNGGIPTVAIITNEQITHLRLEHVWVEAWVDAAPSRGAVQRQGDSWVQLDASFKQHQVKQPLDLAAAVPVDFGALTRDVAREMRTDADGAVTQIYPGYIRTVLGDYLAQAQQALDTRLPGYDVGDVLGDAQITPRGSSVLPSGLPYEVVTRGASTNALPSTLRASVTLTMYGSSIDRAMDTPGLSYTVSLPSLGSRRLAVSYTPATDADARLVQSYVDSKASSFPVYLVQVVPRVELDGLVVAQGTPVTMGEAQGWDLSLFDAAGMAGGVDSYEVTEGDAIVFGVNGNGVAQETVTKRLATTPSNSVHENLHQVALHYWLESDLLDKFAARARGVHEQRVLSAGMFSFPLGVSYLFGLPRSGSYQKQNMDVKRSQIAVAAASAQARVEYMSQAGIQESYLESSIWEQLFSRFQGRGYSTAQVLMDAANEGIPIYTLDAGNAALLSKVTVSDEARATISSALAAGKRVIVPQRAPRGVSGYVIQDVQTGGGAYMIDGELAGGLGEKCEPQSEPVPEWVKVLVISVLIMAIMAWMAGTMGAGGVLVPALARVMMLATTASFTLYAGNAYAGERFACCTVNPICPHAGGDLIHDVCADALPPNEIPGCDAKVDGLRFDAVSGGREVLWEIKSNNLANSNAFVQMMMLIGMRVELAEEQKTAHACGYSFALGAGDFGLITGVFPNYDWAVQAPAGTCLQLPSP